MKSREIILCMGFIFSFIGLSMTDSVYAQFDNEVIFSDEELIIGYSISIAIVIGIFMFLARDIILRKKTKYDVGDFESKKDKDYEKYHSDWLDDTVGFRPSRKKLNSEEFRKAAKESSLPNYYDILDVDPHAHSDEIRKKFRDLAKKWHPDKKHDEESEKKMTEINEAYEVLSDDEKRKNYDKYFTN